MKRKRVLFNLSFWFVALLLGAAGLFWQLSLYQMDEDIPFRRSNIAKAGDDFLLSPAEFMFLSNQQDLWPGFFNSEAQPSRFRVYS